MEVTVVEKIGNRVVLKLPRLVDLRNGFDVKEEILNEFEKRYYDVYVLDLCELEMIDSYGLGILISLQKKMNEFHNKKMCFVNVRDSIKKIFELVKIHDFIDIIGNRTICQR